jgi:hypothetical protein
VPDSWRELCPLMEEIGLWEIKGWCMSATLDSCRRCSIVNTGKGMIIDVNTSEQETLTIAGECNVEQLRQQLGGVYSTSLVIRSKNLDGSCRT